MAYIAFDTETYRIGATPLAKAPEGPGVLAVAPKIVCLQTAVQGKGEISRRIEAGQTIKGAWERMLEGKATLVGLWTAFDLTVLAANYPETIPLIFKAFDEHRITCAVVQEKLIDLATTGDLKYLTMPDGSTISRTYGMAELVKTRLGIEIKHTKDGDIDELERANYHRYDNVPLDQWPASAIAYALDDAEYTLKIHQSQLGSLSRIAGTPYTEEQFLRLASIRTQLDFSLRLSTCHGLHVDRDLAAQKLEEAQTALKVVTEPLIKAGFVIAAKPERPHKRGAKSKATGLPLMAKATKESESRKKAQEAVEAACKAADLPIPRTDKGNVAADAATLKELAAFDPDLDLLLQRHKLTKLTGTYLPKLIDATTFHPDYECLKATGRTSSRGSTKYPSDNIQNVDPRVRPCYVARPGHVMVSDDYSTIELVSLGFVTASMFGQSEHKRILDSGIDLHSFLAVRLYNAIDNKSMTYEEFMAQEKLSPDFFGYWRKFAKPVGLGFPGGMREHTFITYAKGYGIDLVSIAGGIRQAVELVRKIRLIWLATYSEMQQYFDLIENTTTFNDEENTRRAEERRERKRIEAIANGLEPEEHRRPPRKYQYRTPLGMLRRGCDYNAICNGLGLQSPTSDGMMLAINRITRLMYDWTQGSILYGCRLLAAIHDELIVEMPEDEMMHDRALAVSQTMIEAMLQILPGMRVTAEPAIMRRWDKRAKPVYTADGRLRVWDPAFDVKPKAAQ